MNPRTRGSAALLLLLIIPVACTPPLAPRDAGPVLFSQRYTFACGGWSPAEPPATRTLIDLRTSGQTADGRPTPEAMHAIVAAGGRIVRVYNVAMVRAEMLPQQAAPLVHIGRGQASSATTVMDASNVDVVIIVMLSHQVTEADLEKVRALGGTIMNVYWAVSGYSARVSDRLVPAIRALPGVKILEANSIGCLL